MGPTFPTDEETSICQKQEQITGTNKIKKVSKRWPVIFFMFLFLSVPIFNKKKQQKKKTRPNKRKQCKRRPIGNIYLFCFSPFFHFYNLFYFDSTGMENLQYTEKTKLNEEVLCSLMMYDLIHELKFCISLSLFLFFEKPLYQTHFVSTKKRENPPSLLTFTYSICNA